MKKSIIRFLPVLIAFITAGIVFCCSHNSVQEDIALTGFIDEESEDQSGLQTDTAPVLSENADTEEGIWVYVCGAVNNPGVYCLETGSRLAEALEMAGGVSTDALEETLNLASVLTDGQKICVPDRNQAADKEMITAIAEDTTFSENISGLVNINTAGMEELMTLPGIGESKALNIISYREKRPFTSIEDIMNVSGIKEGSYDKIKDLITV